MLKSELEYIRKEKIKVAIEMKKHWMTNIEIAKTLNVNPATVSLWLKQSKDFQNNLLNLINCNTTRQQYYQKKKEKKSNIKKQTITE